MNRNTTSFLALGALACVVIAACGKSDPAPAQTAQAGDTCWIRGSAANLSTRPSALDSASVALTGGTVKVCYGRPHARGRTVMDSLVPYGQPWRIGANEATAIHVPFPAQIAGVNVEPGWYSLYAVPADKQWRIVVNSQAQRWGIPIDTTVQAKDVGSGTVAVEHISDPVEVLTIALRKTSDTSAMMDVSWEKTRVSIPVEKR